VLGATIVLLLRAIGHAQAIASVSHGLTERAANLERVQRRLMMWRSVPQAVRGQVACAGIREIVLHDVGHTYEGAGRAALRGVNLTIRRGEQVGVIGRTGSGKSTLAGLLLGVLEVDEGRLEVNGTPLAELDPTSWRRLAAWVPQEPWLLDGTVADNIRFLRPELDDVAVLAAAELAGLGHELERWPEGIDHRTGSAGSALSGGQRQRVALARALAGSPELVVLDEPTSALDAHTEARVRHVLGLMREEATVVVIAHRLSTLAECDRVVVLDDGEVVATGSAAELADTSSYYREVVALSELRR